MIQLAVIELAVHPRNTIYRCIYIETIESWRLVVLLDGELTVTVTRGADLVLSVEAARFARRRDDVLLW